MNQKRNENNNIRPPGTGKTTTLLNLVDDLYKMALDQNRLVIFHLLKKLQRKQHRGPRISLALDVENDLTYFRTLHSYAFNQLGMTREKMMGSEDYKEFGEKCGIPIKVARVF